MIGGRIELDSKDASALVELWSAHTSWVDELAAGSFVRVRTDMSAGEFCRLIPAFGCSVHWHQIRSDTVRVGMCVEDDSGRRDLFFFAEMPDMEFFSSLSV